MKVKRFFLLGALILLASVFSACSKTPIGSTWPGLAADSTAAYLTNGSIVYAIRLTDGAELWKFPEKPSTKLAFYSNPVFTSDGQLLIGSSGSEHTLFRVDPQTGKDNWSFSGASDHWVASPLVVGDMVYAPNADGYLYVFDLAKEGTDKLVWKVELGGKLWSQPVTDGKFLYVASLDHHLHAVDLETHKITWSITLDGAIAGVPAIDDKRLYIGSLGTALKAINLSDGSTAWTAPTESWVWSGPTLDNGTLYFGDLNGNFYSINAADGKPAADSIKPGGGILATPLLLNGQIIFVTESGAVYSLEPGKAPLTLETLVGKIYTAPVATANLILVAPFQGTYMLVALDANGKQAWFYPPAATP
jgi:outer membrane protein assembly factor BamB